MTPEKTSRQRMSPDNRPTGGRSPGSGGGPGGKPPGSGPQSPDRMGRPQGKTWPILLRLATWILRYKGIVVLIIIGFLFSTALGLLPSWLIRTSLDQFLVPGKSQWLWITASLMIGATMLQGIIDFFTRYLTESRGHQIVFSMRQKVYSHLMNLSFSFFDQNRTGDLLSRVTADTDTLQSFYGFAAVHVICNSLFIAGVMVVMFTWHVQLALLYVCLLPFIFLGITRYAFKIRPAFARTRRILGVLTATLQEQLQGIRITRLFGQEKRAWQVFNRMNSQYMEVNLLAGRITAFWMPYVFVFIGLATGLLLWYGGRLVIGGSVSIGILAGFLTYIGMMMRPIRQTGMLVSQVMNAAAAGERIFDVLDTQPDVRDDPGAVPMPLPAGEIRYDDVSFSYDKQTPVLKNIRFTIHPGETIAVIGPTGAGKSTLVHLLPRFYDPDNGKILIDGKDIRTFTLTTLRQHVGIFMQQTFLFDASIRENIAFGKPDAGDEEIIAVAKAAEIHDFILTLPQGYRTMIGERGVRLSGGQRQRIAIARTLLMNPQILILDEPTSNVDAETDEKIRQAIQLLCRDRTVFIIAHRLWTLQNADRILVLNQGQIAEFDTHEALLRQEGLYARIYHCQADSHLFRWENHQQQQNQQQQQRQQGKQQHQQQQQQEAVKL